MEFSLSKYATPHTQKPGGCKSRQFNLVPATVSRQREPCLQLQKLLSDSVLHTVLPPQVLHHRGARLLLSQTSQSALATKVDLNSHFFISLWKRYMYLCVPFLSLHVHMCVDALGLRC